MRLFSAVSPRRGAGGRAATVAVAAALAALTVRSSPRADGEEVPSVTAADAAGKTGPLRLTLTERSPLSAPADVAKRMRLKPTDAAADYDLSKEVFYAYVPRDPGDDGKYGLLVGLCFKEYGEPPSAWVPVLDKYHLIWINPFNAGDDRPITQRAGLVLDAAAAAQKLWPVDPDRVYFSSNGLQTPANGIAFYYSDLFDGMIQTIGPSWFARLPGFGNPPSIWSTDHMPRPSERDLARAKSHGRFFLANRQTPPDDNVHKANDVIYRRGYVQGGFKYVKTIDVSETDMGHYRNYAADFFDQGVQFLDAPIAELKSKAHGAVAAIPASGPTRAAATPAGAPTSPTADKAAATTAPAASTADAPASPDDAAAKAASALSLAQDYIAAGAYDRARPRLRKIIATYPGTPAAKEAEKTLREIETK